MVTKGSSERGAIKFGDSRGEDPLSVGISAGYQASGEEAGTARSKRRKGRVRGRSLVVATVGPIRKERHWIERNNNTGEKKTTGTLYQMVSESSSLLQGKFFGTSPNKLYGNWEAIPHHQMGEKVS